MGLISRAGDIFYALRFLRLLTKSWDDMDAFKYGIIDNNGKVLRKASTLKNPVEKSSYTIFHRLVFNLKRLLNKLPIGKTKLASYATALFLVKEHSGMTESEMEDVLNKVLEDWEVDTVNEQWFQKDGKINPGKYTLKEDVISLNTGEPIARAKDIVEVKEAISPVGSIFGTDIFEVKHLKTNQSIYINSGEITR
jgi:hypothetical protein